MTIPLDGPIAPNPMAHGSMVQGPAAQESEARGSVARIPKARSSIANWFYFRTTLGSTPAVAILPLVLPLFLTACGAEGAGGPTVTRTDSAGIEIVENAGERPDEGNGWRVDPVPVLSMGSVEGEPDSQFYGISGIHRFPGGRIGVVDVGSRAVRVFGPDGALQARWGRRGSGPEEFEMPVLAGAVGDTLLVVDRAHHRLTLVHPDSGFLGLARISDEVGGYLTPAGSFSNGQSVYGGAFDMRRVGELKNGMNRAHTFYRSSNLDGTMAVDFGDKAGADFFIKDLESDGPGARPAVIPFGRVPVAAVSPHFLFFSDQDRYEIEVYEPSGRLVRLIRLDQNPAPVTAADGERLVQNAIDQAENPEQAAEIRSYYGALPLPETFPPMGNLLADDLDCLWVEEFQRPGAETSAWNVFDDSGAWTGRVVLPARFHPVEVGGDYVLGVGWDELRVEYVRLYSLTRGS